MDSSAAAARTAVPAVPGGVGPATTVTLITGDRVTLVSRSPEPVVDIQPGPGRAQVGFVTLRQGDEITVIPKDVAAAVASQQLDRELFNVTRLLSDGFGDRDRADLPLIVTGLRPGANTAARVATAGLAIDREIPALGVTAMHQAKSSPGAALALVQAATARTALSGAVGPRIWLDRRLHLTLDRSVPQIGGPVAWTRGFTGRGVTVAVLDTGIDASHPDLAGKVVAAETFVDDGAGTSDVNGHATHVASTIAGTGAASGGQFRGVAPDAQLLSGRVCDGEGCLESAILAGMAWAAVDRHAPIVNLSLGGRDLGRPDPLVDAVNQLSAQYGTLFVIAAGNDGDLVENESINSPGSAEAALTVGAVDRQDRVAAFSSRGPNRDGDAIKPDLTAPGVGIVAAMATSVPPIGQPVGTAYQALSGTSMATPHVAGAAALLLQQHPGWSGAQLKAALIASARPTPAFTAFQQGAGRVDVDRATRQQVIPEPATLGLGLAVWPHTDDPIVTRTVTYHNDGPAPITLALTASLTLPDQGAALAGMIRVAPAALTVPAGGSADAVVTVDTNGDGRNGSYTGAVVATSGDTRVATTVAIEREVESYELTMRVSGSEPAFSLVTVFPRILETWPLRLRRSLLATTDSEVTLRLPRGAYALYAIPAFQPVFLAYPNLLFEHDTTVEFDARVARPVDVTVPGLPLQITDSVVGGLDGLSRAGVSTGFDARGFATAQLGPDLLDADYRGFLAFTATAADAEPGSTERYTFAHQEAGHMPTGWTERVPRDQFATIHASHRGDGRAVITRYMLPVHDIGGFTGLFNGVTEPGIAQYTDHVFGNTRWQPRLIQDEPVPDRPTLGLRVGQILSTVRDYRPGQHYVEHWNHAPFGPALAQLGDTGEISPASRRGDTLTVSPTLYADQSLPARFAWTAGPVSRSTLFRNGEPLAASADYSAPFSPVQVPPEAATYRYEQEEIRGPSPLGGKDLFDLSTHVRAAWTFRSGHVAGDAPVILPLPTLRFLPELDEDNRATRRVIVLPVAIERPVGAATPRIEHVTVEVSFDDGATWTSVPGALLGDRWFGIVVHPAGAAYASLRGTVRDVAGNAGEATILHAYRLAAR